MIKSARALRDRAQQVTQYKADPARVTLRGIDEQVRKAKNAFAVKSPAKRHRFITLTGATDAANRDLQAKAHALASIKCYTTDIANPDASP